MNLGVRKAAIFLFVFLCSQLAVAHQLAPALLKITLKSDTQAELYWKEPVSRPAGTSVGPVFPDNCTQVETPVVQKNKQSFIYQWSIMCEQSLIGQGVEINDLSTSKTQVLVVYRNMQGNISTSLLDKNTSKFVIPKTIPMTNTLRQYSMLGAKHLLLGWDHVLFVLGLLALLITRLPALVWAMTAFAAGHSVTLLLVSLHWLPVNARWVEVFIALSLLLLALELLIDDSKQFNYTIRNKPYLLTFVFGLVHGCGFASVLSEYVQSTQHLIPLLLSFNIGLDIGQLLLLAVAYCLYQFNRLKISNARLCIAYVIGSMSTYWLLQRLFV